MIQCLKYLSLSPHVKKEVKKEILNPSSMKVTRKGDIHTNVLMNSISTHLHFLTNTIHSCIEQNKFLADVIPVFKKKSLKKL